MDQSPNISSSVLDELESLIKKYNLTWIPGSKGEGGYFLGKDLAHAKGKDPKDFAKHWATFEKNINWSLHPVPPQVVKLEGENLKNFKSLYQHYTHKSLGSINSLYVVNWSAAYAYLAQGQSQAAQEFQNLGARAVVASTRALVSEQTLHNQLALLALRTSFIFKQELVIADTLRSGQRTRRYDLVQYAGRNVTLYELKRDVVTKEDVMLTVGEKGYLTLAQHHPKFAKKRVKLVFVSPMGIEPAAQRLLDQMPKVEYVSLFELACRLLEDALKEIQQESPAQVGWYLKEKFLKDYPDIFPTQQAAA